MITAHLEQVKNPIQFLLGGGGVELTTSCCNFREVFGTSTE
jgi:hypothetical protein